MIRNNILAVDVAVAVVIAVIVLIISPGLAVTGLIALLVFAVLGISFAWSHRRHRRRMAPKPKVARPQPRTRPPSGRPGGGRPR